MAYITDISSLLRARSYRLLPLARSPRALFAHLVRKHRLNYPKPWPLHGAHGDHARGILVPIGM